MDSVVPVLIAGMIGFYAILRFLTTNEWYEQCFGVAYPIWVIYFSGSLRVMIVYVDWSRWEVILYKLTVMFCGLIFFYVGFEYMNGKYKISQGFLTEFENTLKELTYLYVFGNVELFF